MPQTCALLDSLRHALSVRAQMGMTIVHFDQLLPSHAPDFFSNDYLSLSTDRSVRDGFLHKVQAADPARLLGSGGSRVLTGGSTELNMLEKAFQQFFAAPSALLFSSGFGANTTFLASVPQRHDVIIYDDLLHASSRQGVRLAPCSSYRFANNSAASLRECILAVLQNHPQISHGCSTVFVLVESLYSMDGDFCPLTEIVELVESLVPAGHAHIVVDEAHTSGICGPNGTGYVSHLGLSARVHTKIHTFGKGWGFHGAVVLTSPIVKDYLSNFGKGVMFTTAMPYTDIYALDSCLLTIRSGRGEELRQRLYCLSRYANEKMSTTLENVPKSILALKKKSGVSDPALCSPIIPILTPHAAELTCYLLKKGYAATAITYPAVSKPRIRITLHAGNTEEEIDTLARELLAWAVRQQGLVDASKARESNGADQLNEKARARL